MNTRVTAGPYTLELPPNGVADAVERVARAVRRRQFERTRRLSAYDPTVAPTENELDDARAAIAAMPQPAEQDDHDHLMSDSPMTWRPIASAPKDGSPVLIWGPCNDPRSEYVVACWSTREREWFSPVSDGTWTEESVGTHWIPLPAPPRETGDE